MEPKVRQALEARFDDLVKKRRGSFGKEIHYVEGAAIVARLNDAFAADWSFSIVSHSVLATGEVLVHGRLVVYGVTKEAFGRGNPAVSKETGEVLSMADAFKAAATDALKKCATLLGVAGYLYTDEPLETDEPKPAFPRSAQRNPNNPNNAHSPANDRLTQRQLSTLWSMGRRLGLDAEAIRKRCREEFGSIPEQLNKTDASAFISELERRIEKQRGAA
jgi:hypothetical protein